MYSGPFLSPFNAKCSAQFYKKPIEVTYLEAWFDAHNSKMSLFFKKIISIAIMVTKQGNFQNTPLLS